MRATAILADDDADYRFLVSTFLQHVADLLEIIGEASDGQEALNLARKSRPNIVVSDVMMPGMDGVALAERLREELPDTRIILMSSIKDETDPVRITAADAFIDKYSLPTALVPAIRQLASPHGQPGFDPKS